MWLLPPPPPPPPLSPTADAVYGIAAAVVLVAATIAVHYLRTRRTLTSPKMKASIAYSSSAARLVIKELAETEQTYLRDLQRLDECRRALPSTLALGQCESLLLLHTELQARLLGTREAAPTTTTQSASTTPTASTVAQAFLFLGPFLKAYSEYGALEPWSRLSGASLASHLQLTLTRAKTL